MPPYFSVRNRRSSGGSRTQVRYKMHYLPSLILYAIIVILACFVIYNNRVRAVELQVEEASRLTNFSPTFYEIYDQSTVDECNRLIVVQPFQWHILAKHGSVLILNESLTVCDSSSTPAVSIQDPAHGQYLGAAAHVDSPAHNRGTVYMARHRAHNTADKKQRRLEHKQNLSSQHATATAVTTEPSRPQHTGELIADAELDYYFESICLNSTLTTILEAYMQQRPVIVPFAIAEKQQEAGRYTIMDALNDLFVRYITLTDPNVHLEPVGAHTHKLSLNRLRMNREYAPADDRQNHVRTTTRSKRSAHKPPQPLSERSDEASRYFSRPFLTRRAQANIERILALDYSNRMASSTPNSSTTTTETIS